MKNLERFFAGIVCVVEFLWDSKKELFYGIRFLIGFFWCAVVFLFVCSLFTHGTERGEIVEMGLFTLRNYPIASVVSILVWLVPMALSSKKKETMTA